DVRFADDEPLRLTAGFARNLARHQARLLEVLPHPGAVDFVEVPLSAAARQNVKDAIGAQLESHCHVGPKPDWWAVGDGFGTVSVDLSADGEQLAADLFAQHGAGVELWVGTKPYPPVPGYGATETLQPKDPPDGLSVS